MSQRIKLSDSNFWDATSLSLDRVSADWIATTAGNGAKLTDDFVLTPGKWLVIVKTAYTSTSWFQMEFIVSSAGTTDINSDNAIFGGASETTYVTIINVSTTTTIYAKLAQSASVTFSNIARGGVKAIKLSA